MRFLKSLAGGLLVLSLLSSCGGGSAPDLAAAKADAAFTGNGIWWNPAESGSGFFFEAQGTTGVVTFYVYDGGGRPVWYTAAGPLASGTGGTFRFSGDLLQYFGGQGGASATPKTPVSSVIGTVTIAFDGEEAQVQVPGRSFAAQKFNRAGKHVPATANEPQTGIYWNAGESGRGYVIEVADHVMTLAVFHYAPDGRATWNLVVGPVAADSVARPLEFTAYAGGQTLEGSYKPPASSASQGLFSTAFTGACSGAFAFPQMSAVAITRFSFGGAAACVNQPPATSGGLSQTQALFEENMLAGNGGGYQLLLSVSYSVPRQVLSVTTLRQDMLTSPTGSPQGATGTQTRASGISSSTQAANPQEAAFGEFHVANGQLHLISNAATPRYTYADGAIDVEHASVGGQYTMRRRITSVEKVPLSGKFAQAPQEFLGFFGLLSSSFKTDAAFLPGAAYYRYVAMRPADQLVLDDADGNPQTHPGSVTPLFTGTIEQYAAANMEPLELSAGNIRTTNGLRCWIGKTAAPYKNNYDALIFSSVNPTYRALCQLGDGVYGGNFQPAGAVIGGLFRLLTTDPPFAFTPAYVLLNKAAVDSLSAMVK